MTTVVGERRFAAPPQRVYELLTDPETMTAAVPGARDLRVLDADHWQAKVKPPFPFAPSVSLRFAVADRRPAEHARLQVEGGGSDVSSTFDLAPDGDGTVMRWRTEIRLSGLLARFAGPGLGVVAERQAGKVLDVVERRL